MNQLKVMASRILSLIENSTITANACPSYIKPILDNINILRNSGKYKETLEAYINLIEKENVVYITLLFGIYKTIALTGYLYEAKRVLLIGDEALKNNQSVINPLNLPNNFTDNLNRLEYAISSEETLLNYLRVLSSSSAYIIPRSYNIIKKEYEQKLH